MNDWATRSSAEKARRRLRRWAIIGLVRHSSFAELEAVLDHVRRAPRDVGTVELVVRRPAAGQREVLASAELCTARGVVGDDWVIRPSRSTPDGRPHPGKQVTLVNARSIEAIAGARERWPLAGDQLYVDFDLSEEALPTGAQVVVGDAVIEVSGEPHHGCPKYVERFGADAMRFVNTPVGRALRLRGLNASVVRSGRVAPGDAICRLG